MLVTLATVGGNLPDIDLVLTYRGFVRDKLGYLLEHRGYTHTVLGCLVLATLMYAAAEGWARYRRLSMTRNDHLTLAAVAVLGTLLHLGMDALEQLWRASALAVLQRLDLRGFHIHCRAPVLACRRALVFCRQIHRGARRRGYSGPGGGGRQHPHESKLDVAGASGAR